MIQLTGNTFSKINVMGIIKRGYVNSAIYDGSNTVYMAVKLLGNEDKKNLTEIIGLITNQLHSCDMHSCCEYCGNTGELAVVSVDKKPKVLCDKCFGETKNGNIDKFNYKQEKGNVVLEVIGAIIGTALGGTLWILLSQIGIIFCIVLACLTIPFSEISSLAISVFMGSRQYGISIFDAFFVIPTILTDKSAILMLVKDVSIGYVFAIWGSFTYVIGLFNSIVDIKKPRETTVLWKI